MFLLHATHLIMLGAFTVGRAWSRVKKGHERLLTYSFVD